MKNISGVGDRLREERIRLDLSQNEVAAVGGVSSRTQSAYEAGDRTLDSDYLRSLRDLGVDIYYVLTGERLPSGSQDDAVADDDEREMLRKYRLLNDAGKAAVEAAMNGYLLAGSFTRSGKPDKRIPRLAANRAAAMNAETAEVVRRALDEQRERADTRAKKRGDR